MKSSHQHAMNFLFILVFVLTGCTVYPHDVEVERQRENAIDTQEAILNEQGLYPGYQREAAMHIINADPQYAREYVWPERRYTQRGPQITYHSPEFRNSEVGNTLYEMTSTQSTEVTQGQWDNFVNNIHHAIHHEIRLHSARVACTKERGDIEGEELQRCINDTWRQCSSRGEDLSNAPGIVKDCNAVYRNLRAKLPTRKNPSFHTDCRDCPVERINLPEAMLYANWLSKIRGLEECYPQINFAEDIRFSADQIAEDLFCEENAGDLSCNQIQNNAFCKGVEFVGAGCGEGNPDCSCGGADCHFFTCEDIPSAIPFCSGYRLPARGDLEQYYSLWRLWTNDGDNYLNRAGGGPSHLDPLGQILYGLNHWGYCIDPYARDISDTQTLPVTDLFLSYEEHNVGHPFDPELVAHPISDHIFGNVYGLLGNVAEWTISSTSEDEDDPFPFYYVNGGSVFPDVEWGLSFALPLDYATMIRDLGLELEEIGLIESEFELPSFRDTKRSRSIGFRLLRRVGFCKAVQLSEANEESLNGRKRFCEEPCITNVLTNACHNCAPIGWRGENDSYMDEMSGSRFCNREDNPFYLFCDEEYIIRDDVDEEGNLVPPYCNEVYCLEHGEGDPEGAVVHGLTFDGKPYCWRELFPGMGI